MVNKNMRYGQNQSSSVEKAMGKAASYVNIKPRTRWQVVKYLKEKGFTEDSITEAIKELEEYRYIDDLQYSKMYFEYGFEKGRGIGRIKRELSEKGVDSDVINIAFEELEDIPDQIKAAMDVGESMIKDIDVNELDYESRKKLQAKIGRRLMSRGYTSEVAYKVINRLV